jgi:prephenate dehydrogenase
MTSQSATIGIAGLGLMGGSLALALRRRGGRTVVGYDPVSPIQSTAGRVGQRPAAARKRAQKFAMSGRVASPDYRRFRFGC